jgi:hypothetical protein
VTLTLRFRPTTAPVALGDLAAFLRARPHYRVDDQAATYANEDTAVSFVLRVELAPGDTLPLALDVPTDVPIGFALEIEGEMRAMIERFSLAIADGERLGISGGVYETGSFLRAWQRASVRAHATRVAHEGETPLHLPEHTLEQTWRWNHGRVAFEQHLAGSARVLAITYHPSPSGSRRLVTATLWTPPEAVVVPEVDVLRIATPAGMRRIDGGSLTAALGDIRFAPASDAAPLRHLAITLDTVSGDARAAVLTASIEGDLAAEVAPASVAIEERVADAIVMPRVRAVADGADAGDLEVTLYTTSAHRTFTTTIRGNGEVAKAEIFVPGEEVVGTVPLTDVRALAKVVASTEFPHLHAPPGPPPPPTVPPVRVTIRAGGLSLSAEMPASVTDAVPDFAAILGKIATVAAHAEQEAKTDPSPPIAGSSEIDRVLDHPDAPAFGAALRAFPGYLVVWIGQTLATEPNERGEPYAAVFTADGRIDAYLARHGLTRAQIATSTLDGNTLFSQIGAYPVLGFDFDPGGPLRRAFPLALAARVLGLPAT